MDGLNHLDSTRVKLKNRRPDTPTGNSSDEGYGGGGGGGRPYRGGRQNSKRSRTPPPRTSNFSSTDEDDDEEVDEEVARLTAGKGFSRKRRVREIQEAEDSSDSESSSSSTSGSQAEESSGEESEPTTQRKRKKSKHSKKKKASRKKQRKEEEKQRKQLAKEQAKEQKLKEKEEARKKKEEEAKRKARKRKEKTRTHVPVGPVEEKPAEVDGDTGVEFSDVFGEEFGEVKTTEQKYPPSNGNSSSNSSSSTADNTRGVIAQWDGDEEPVEPMDLKSEEKKRESKRQPNQQAEDAAARRRSEILEQAKKLADEAKASGSSNPDDEDDERNFVDVPLFEPVALKDLTPDHKRREIEAERDVPADWCFLCYFSQNYNVQYASQDFLGRLDQLQGFIARARIQISHAALCREIQRRYTRYVMPWQSRDEGPCHYWTLKRIHEHILYHDKSVSNQLELSFAQTARISLLLGNATIKRSKITGQLAFNMPVLKQWIAFLSAKTKMASDVQALRSTVAGSKQ